MGPRSVEASVRGIGSPLSNGVCQLGGVGWLGWGCIKIIKVSVVIIDSVCWVQNVGMLVWVGRNVLGCPLGIPFCGRQ